MELRALEYFLAVCQEGNMSKAAEALHLTQPTLSRQIADLERELNCTLLIRGRHLELTEEGVILRRRAEELLQLANQTRQEISNVSEIEGVVRIAAGESWGISLLASVMQEMRERFPRVRFAIHSGNGEDVKWRLDRGLADFAVFMSNTNLGEYNTLRLPPTDAYGLLMPTGHPLAAHEVITPNDLLGVPLIVSEGNFESHPLSTWSRELRDEYQVVGTYSLAYNAAVLVKEHLGCALVFDRIVASGADSGLEFRLLYPPAVSFQDLVWKRRQPLSLAAKAFLNAVSAKVSGNDKVIPPQ